MPSFISIRQTVWPQYTNVTDKQTGQTDRQLSDSIGRTVLQTVAQKPHVQTSRNFLYLLTVAVARFSCEDNEIRSVLQVLWMTSRLSTIGQAKAMPVGRIVKVSHQMAASGATSDVYECLVIYTYRNN